MLSDQVASFRSESVVLSRACSSTSWASGVRFVACLGTRLEEAGLPLIKVSKVSEPSFDLFFFFFRVDTEVP